MDLLRPMRRLRRSLARGFTLIELLLVVVLIGILSAVATRTLDGVLETGRWEATTQEMDRLSWAIAGNPELYANGVRTDFGYVGDVGSLPPNLDALVTNPGGYSTWRGPYIRNDFTQNPDDYKLDGWGNAYTYTGEVTLTSGGSGGNALTRQIANAVSDLTQSTVQGVVTDGLGNPPGPSSSNVAIKITYPDGAGGFTTSTVNPNGSGNYAFNALVPQGVRTLIAIYSTKQDTLVRSAVVLPASTCIVDFRFRGSLWSVLGSGGDIVYVANTATTQSSGTIVQFDVRNVGSAAVSVTSLKATYATTAWYERIDWGATAVANSTNPRWASGQVVTFSAAQSFPPGAVITIYLKNFKTAISGGSNKDMRGTSFTVLFSDGSTVSFAV